MSLIRYKHYILLLTAFLAVACANRGIGPQGGARDTVPPLVLEEIPLNGTLGFNEQRIEIRFDEYIQLDKPQDNIVISPPQVKQPEVRAVGKKILVNFEEPLIDSTTYTIDFGNSICDNNEKIPLKNYTFSFSTGNVLDSLGIFGQIVNAEDLNPVAGVVAGIHAVLDDSAFTTQPFTRIARSDSMGYFGIKNIRPATYRLYALQDVSRDYLYQAGEGLAFNDTLYTPFLRTADEVDTLWKFVKEGDSLVRVPDSVMNRHYKYMEPSDVVLWFFNEDKQKHYFQRLLRENKHNFMLVFSAPQTSLPVLRPLNPALLDSSVTASAWVDWSPYILPQYSRNKDTVVYWITDSLAMYDTLAFEMSYLKDDDNYVLTPQTDTLFAVWHAPRVNAATQAKLLAKQRAAKITLKSNAKSGFDVFDTIRLSCDAPIAAFHKDSVRLLLKKDTAWQEVGFDIMPVDSARTAFYVLAKLSPSMTYELRIDSAAMTDIYGHTNNAFAAKVQLKSMEEYATLKVIIQQYDPLIRLQLLDDKDNVIRDVKASPDGTLLQYVHGGTYYMRLYYDYNNDGRWTTGDWLEKRQPEPVYYFPYKLGLRANWDFEEMWDHLAIPQLESKPSAIIKTLSAQKKK